MIKGERSLSVVLLSILSAVHFAGACSEGSAAGNDGSSGADGGGLAGAPGSAGDGGASGAFCEQPQPECCLVDPRTLCVGLNEVECAERPYCRKVTGGPWSAGDPDPSIGGRSAVQFVGCRSDCGSGFPDMFLCVADPAHPETCFWTNAEAPDGWEYDFFCGDPGYCGVPAGIGGGG